MMTDPPSDGDPRGAAACGAPGEAPARHLSVADAHEAIRALVRPVDGVERVAIRAALDRVLAEDVVSTIDVPAHDNSAMDGFAIRAVDLSPSGASRFAVIGTAYAGRPLGEGLGPGQAARVMTGAVMPAGADTVVVQEVCQLVGTTLHVPPGQVAGQNRRRRGEDLARGKPALAAGKRLTPADLGLMASLGCAEVLVRRRVRVAFFSSGDELRSIGEPLEAGQIYDSNRYTIHGMLRRLGVDLIDMGVIPDRPDALESAVRMAASNADAIISSGGVSVGEADFTRQVMGRLGDVDFWTIAMRPGRPMAFGRVGAAYYFGLPGNPVAVMVTFYFFARDALMRLAGATHRPLPYVRARTATPIRKKAGRTEYQRGVLAGGPGGDAEVRLTGGQGSGVLRSMSEANCIVVLHHGQGDVAAGESVDCIAFDGLT